MRLKTAEKMNKNREVLSNVIALALPLILFIILELVLSGIQLVRWGRDITPYQVTPILRPIVSKFIDVETETEEPIYFADTVWDLKTDRMKPGNYYQFKSLEPYSVNSYGIKGAEFDITKPKGEYRIISFGGSQTYGTFDKNEETYSALLKQDLERAFPEKRFEVLNFGFPSKSLYYLARQYYKVVDELKPDLVIFNNIRNTWRYDSNPESINYADVFNRKRYIATRVSEYLAKNCLTYRFTRKIFRILSVRVKRQMEGGEFFKYNKEFYETEYYEMCKGLVSHAHEHNIRVLFILEPYNVSKDIQLKHKAMSKAELFNTLDEYQKYLKEANFTEQEKSEIWQKFKSYVDPTLNSIWSALLYDDLYRLKNEFPEMLLLDPVEQFLNKNEEKNLFEDTIHFTHDGNKALSSLIFDTIRPLIEETNDENED